MKLFLTLTVCVFIVAAGVLIYQSQEINRTYRNEVVKGLKRTEEIENRIITEKDIDNLPEPVKNYLIEMGSIGTPKIANVRIKAEGQFKLDKDKNWSSMKVEQYNFFDQHPSRISFMTLNVFGIPLYGLDSYLDGKGSMQGKLLGLVTLINGTGKEMNRSEAAVFLSEMCTTPAALIDNRIEWEEIDQYSAKATFTDHGNKVSGILHFNKRGELTEFTTKDKLRQEKNQSYSVVEWSLLIQDYKKINGYKVGTNTQVVWHLPEGDFTYGKLRLVEIEMNGKAFK